MFKNTLILTLLLFHINNLKCVSYKVAYEWSVVNFTWRNSKDYKNALTTKQYIPENNIISGIKIYKDNMYVALPKFKKGSPITLGKIRLRQNASQDVLIKPYPSWKMNSAKKCNYLQSVQSMEIDSNGIMWILDGMRINNITNCPQKLILLDLNKKGKVVRTYVFPESVSSSNGGVLNDLVVDETDGTYAYITESSSTDPGLIIYSHSKNTSWKIRDSTMFSDKEATDFTVGGAKIKGYHSINGIALEPQGDEDDVRLLYYSALSSYKLYAIRNDIVKSEELCKGTDWRGKIKYIGSKEPSDALTMDNKGNLYYGMITAHAIGVWNMKKPFNTTKQFVNSKKDISWINSFAFDNTGNMFVAVCNASEEFNAFYRKNYAFGETSAYIKNSANMKNSSYIKNSPYIKSSRYKKMYPYRNNQTYKENIRKNNASHKKKKKKPKTKKKIRFKILKIDTGTDSYLYLGNGD